MEAPPKCGLLIRAYGEELKNYFRLSVLARSSSADPELVRQAHEQLFRTRTSLEGSIQRAIHQSPVDPDARLDALFEGSFFGFSKKQGTSLRLPLRTCTPTKLCAGGCYAHDVLDATPAAVVRGAINGWIADRYEKGGEEVRAELSDRLAPHVKRAIKNAIGELRHLPSGFERRAFIRFSHVGEIVYTPTFANDLARKVRDLSEGDVDCVVYTRHKRAIELDPDLWVMNFTLDPASEDRKPWVPPHARIVYSAFGGRTSPDAEVNFLEHHRHGHLAQVGDGRTCPATRPDAKDRTCDGNQCNRCFVSPNTRRLTPITLEEPRLPCEANTTMNEDTTAHIAALRVRVDLAQESVRLDLHDRSDDLAPDALRHLADDLDRLIQARRYLDEIETTLAAVRPRSVPDGQAVASTSVVQERPFRLRGPDKERRKTPKSSPPLRVGSGGVTVKLTFRGGVAHGELDGKGLTVKAGSHARADLSPSFWPAYIPTRERLLAEGTIVVDGRLLRFTRDVRFTSPSQAAQMIQGRSANGRTEWKLADGRTLKALEDDPEVAAP